jgi:hypothetical protein
MNRSLKVCRWEEDTSMPPAVVESEWEVLVIDRPACSLPLMPCPFYRIGHYCCHADNQGGACPLLHRAQSTTDSSCVNEAPR